MKRMRVQMRGRHDTLDTQQQQPLPVGDCGCAGGLAVYFGGGGFVKKSEVFRAAMPQLATSDDGGPGEWGCCDAILVTTLFNPHIAYGFFKRLFADPKNNPLFWWGDVEEGYTARIIALELAALIAEEEGD